MASMKEFLEAWPKTPYGQEFLQDLALKIKDPALFFYPHPEDTALLKVIGIPREKVQEIAVELLGVDAPITQMIGRKSDVFYWAFYASPEERLLLGFSCTPAKRNLS